MQQAVRHREMHGEILLAKMPEASGQAGEESKKRRGSGMALSDCVKCWDTPCSCGYGYRSWSLPQLVSLRDVLNREIATRLAQEGGWTAPARMQKGDTFTMSGRYKRRTFRQWLTRQPRELQRYRVVGEGAAGGLVEYDLIGGQGVAAADD
jgi:hypothetical protein